MSFQILNLRRLVRVALLPALLSLPFTEIRLNGAQRQPPPYYDNSVALLIGLSDYRTLRDLSDVQEDIERLKRELEDTSKRRYPFKVQKLIDPTNEEIDATIDRVLRNFKFKKEGGRLFIYVVGRGHEGHRGPYLAGRDFDPAESWGSAASNGNPEEVTLNSLVNKFAPPNGNPYIVFPDQAVMDPGYSVQVALIFDAGGVVEEQDRGGWGRHVVEKPNSFAAERSKNAFVVMTSGSKSNPLSGPGNRNYATQFLKQFQRQTPTLREVFDHQGRARGGA